MKSPQCDVLEQMPRTQLLPDSPDVAEDLPIPVAQDYGEVEKKADEAVGIIVRHLAFESKLQGKDLTADTLCPEQKTSLTQDLMHL